MSVFFNSGQNISTYSSIATTTLILCDILDTLPSEVVYVWFYHRKANWTTLFYVITRYLPFAFVLASCITCFWSQNGIFDIMLFQYQTPSPIQTLGQAQGLYLQYSVPWYIVLACTEILFVMRTVALYGGSSLDSTLLLRTLAGLFLCEMTIAIGCFIILFEFGPPPVTYYSNPTFRGDNYAFVYQVISIPRELSNLCFALPELAFQAILVLLVITRVLSDWKTRVPNNNLVSTITRDGLWSYFSNLCSLLVILIQPSWLTGPSGLPNILWAFVSFSITSTHLILNIRAAAEKRWEKEDRTIPTVDTRLTFVQSVRSFFTIGADEFSMPYHYSDFGHETEDDNVNY